MRRDGELVEASWEEAFAAVDEGLSRVLADGGRDAVAVYLGNPSAHSLGPTLYGPALLKALGTKNIYSASTVDQMPKQVASGLMFGGGLSVPIPDVDRTDHLLILGANPLVSNGSLLTAPDMRGRIRAIRERGGKVVVVDPRRSRTAKEADEHHFIRPGTDAQLLFAIVNVLIAEGLADPGALAELANGADEIEPLARPFTPEAVAPVCGIDADEIRRMARELAAAERRRRLRRASGRRRSASARSRAGSSTSSTTSPATSTARAARCSRSPPSGQRNSAGRGPTGKGRRRRPLDEPRRAACPSRSASCRSPPSPRRSRRPARARSGRWSRSPATRSSRPPTRRRSTAAVEDLDFMVSRRHLRQRDHPPRRRHPPRPRAAGEAALRHRALPARRPQRRQLVAARSCRSPTARPQEWEIMLRLAAIAAGQGPDADIEAWDDLVVADADRPRGRARRLADRGPRPGRDHRPRSATAAAPSG